MEEFIKDSPKSEPKKITLCGLNEKEIRKFVGLLEPLSHALDEKDWSRVKQLEKDLDEIEKTAQVMTKAGCLCPPHWAFKPREKVTFLKEHIQSKNDIAATKCINDLLFALLGDV